MPGGKRSPCKGLEQREKSMSCSPRERQKPDHQELGFADRGAEPSPAAVGSLQAVGRWSAGACGVSERFPWLWVGAGLEGGGTWRQGGGDQERVRG